MLFYGYKIIIIFIIIIFIITVTIIIFNAQDTVCKTFPPLSAYQPVIRFFTHHVTNGISTTSWLSPHNLEKTLRMLVSMVIYCRSNSDSLQIKKKIVKRTLESHKTVLLVLLCIKLKILFSTVYPVSCTLARHLSVLLDPSSPTTRCICSQ